MVKGEGQVDLYTQVSAHIRHCPPTHPGTCMGRSRTSSHGSDPTAALSWGQDFKSPYLP